MKFLHPEILYALAAVVIPLIVHLFNFRKFKKVSFSNIDFLKEVKLETKSKSRLKHILVLISRMLAITALVFAFAQPYIPTEEGGQLSKSSYVQVYIDNSFSMEAENENGNLLAIAKAKAEEIVNYYAPTDKFSLTTNDFEGRHQRWVNKEELLELIDEVDFTPISRSIAEVITRQSDLKREEAQPVKDFIISDLQASTSSLNGLVADSLRELVVVPTLSATVGNAWVDSLWFNSPVRLKEAPEKMSISVNHSREEKVQDQSIKLFIDGQQKAIGSYALEPNLATDTSLTFSVNNTGWHTGVVQIDDAPVSYDDDMYFSYKMADKVAVLEIHEKQSDAVAFRRLFDGDDQFAYESSGISKVDYSGLSAFQLIVVNQVDKISTGLQTELTKFANNGGTIILIPSSSIQIGSYNQLLRSWNGPQLKPRINKSLSASKINMESYVYRGVFESDRMPRNLDLPKVSGYHPIASSARSYQESLITFQNGAPLLLLNETGLGRLALFTTSLDKASSNLTEHALFVTSILRLAESSQDNARLFYTIGDDAAILLRNLSVTGDEVLKVKSEKGQYEFIPQHTSEGGNTRVFVRNQIADAGHYTIFKGQEQLAKVAFNFSRKESQLAAIPTDELLSEADARGINMRILTSGAEALASEVKLLNEGKTFWRSFIIMALIMLALEILFIKFLK